LKNEKVVQVYHSVGHFKTYHTQNQSLSDIEHLMIE